MTPPDGKKVGVISNHLPILRMTSDAVVDEINNITPSYLKPNLIRTTKSVIETDSGNKVLFFNNIKTIKGISFDQVYIDDSVSNEDLMYLMPMIRHRS